MIHQDMADRTHKMLVSATKTIREYAGSEISTQAIELLDALSASYCLDLVYVQPEDLIRVQSALRQVAALRAVFANDGIDIPKI